MIERDITATESYRATARFLAEALAVGSGEIFDLSDLAVSPDGQTLAAAGSLIERLEGTPYQRICLVDLETGALRQITDGTHHDRLPRWSPGGDRIAYLSDARQAHDFQLRILTPADGAIIDVPIAGRWVEALYWAGDASQILLLTAGHGADVAGAQGAVATATATVECPGWMPELDLGEAIVHWRTLWLYDLASGDLQQVSPPGVNVWEACWCGPQVACIASDDPSEDAWYSADIRLIDIERRDAHILYRPADQLGYISASPSGRSIAFAEAVCSDRTLVAGTMMVGGADRDFVAADTGGVDVCFTAWQGEQDLLFAGLRGAETVLGLFDPGSARSRTIWASADRTFGNALLPEAVPLAEPGAALFVAEGFLSPPALVITSPTGPEKELPFGRFMPVETIRAHAIAEQVAWQAQDGLAIHGYLLSPAGAGPHPLVMNVHGGPVWRVRPRYIGRGGNAALLLDAGVALFYPNARGSCGQGQNFARSVFGDVGGADACDLLAGLDHLVARGSADASRIGVTGHSYGGFMTAWLITQDQRFAAAVASSPITDWLSAKFTSNVSISIDMMMGSTTADASTLHLARSPILFADRVKTPTLTICGALDRCTPPGQGQEFHQALNFAGVPSALLTYPGEGHGPRQYPALVDYNTRLVDWFTLHLMADRPCVSTAAAA